MSFAHKNVDLLRRFRLVATGTTGQLLRDQLELDVHRYRSGPLGGDVQIAARIVEGDVFAVIFFVDPLDKHPHEPDIQTLLRACNVHNVPLATNEATAHYIIARETVEDVAAAE
jgi:methylglyoxal synthase